jgi:hypothetical protein
MLSITHIPVAEVSRSRMDFGELFSEAGGRAWLAAGNGV